MTAPVDYQRFDHQRRTVVFQLDHAKVETTTEWKAHATQAEIAKALCDNNLPDYHVVGIVEFWIADGKCVDVTEDVAKLIPAIARAAYRDDRRFVRSCARDLMERFGLADPANEQFRLETNTPFSALSQLGLDNERNRRAMAGA
jgi:hypothetical protein